MFKNYTFLYLFICLLCVSQLSSAQQKTINFSELEATVNEELKATNTPGAAVAVVGGDRVVFARGFGVSDIETGRPVNPDTLFRIASTTKMLTAAALVTLAEQGRIKLDAPVGKYLQGLSPKLAQVTVHQLLSHTAGIRDGFSFHGLHDDSALGGFVRSWTDDYLIAEPGEIFSYSNLGYALAGFVLEQVMGKPYADAMNDVLFQPLGMRRTTLRPIMAMTYPLSQGHDILPGQTNPTVVRPFADDARYWANGGVFTSVTDFSRFAIAFMNGGKIEGGQALSPTVIAKLSTPYVDIPGGNNTEHPKHAYGLNVRDYRGVRVLQHGGLRVGFGSLVRIVPEHHFAVIILTNKSNGLLLKTLEKATELVVPLQPKTTTPPRGPIAMNEAEMRSYAATYQNAPDYLRLELVVKDGKLFSKQAGQSEMSQVVKVGDNIFNTGGQEFLLIPGTDGKAKYMHIAAHALRRIAECPQINVECPDPFDEKPPLQFKALVKGNAHQNVTYSWSVSKGEIKSGQGTATIVVEVGDGERQGLTATVEVGGLSKECAKTASCTTMISSLALPLKAAPNNISPCENFNWFGLIAKPGWRLRL